MTTVSGKAAAGLTVALFASVLISGCTALMPVERPAQGQAPVDDPRDRSQRVSTVVQDAPLPQQPYDRTGKKLPFVPQPNPYAAQTNAVPDEATAGFVVASGLVKQGKLKAAKKQFESLTVRFPTLSGPWAMLGVIAEKEEKFDEAIGNYRKAISVNEKNVNAYLALGLVQRKQGYFGDAQATYVEALEVWRDFPEAHLNLAILYDLYVNQPEQAQKHYEAYHFLTGGRDTKVHKWLVEVKQRTGIERSFIDVPPKGVAEVAVKESGSASPGGDK